MTKKFDTRGIGIVNRKVKTKEPEPVPRIKNFMVKQNIPMPPKSSPIPRVDREDLIVKTANEFILEDFKEELNSIDPFKKVNKIVKIERIKDGALPQLNVIIPDKWPSIILAPLYDIHRASPEHDNNYFLRCIKWIRDTDNVISFLGGDALETAGKHSVGDSDYKRTMTTSGEFKTILKELAPIRDKLLFNMPGNHEDRMFKEMGFDIAEEFSDRLDLEHFQDYCFIVIYWRGLKFKIGTHHGAGGGTSVSAKANIARKEIVNGYDLDAMITGHLHDETFNKMMRFVFNTRTNTFVQRESVGLICSSFVKSGIGQGSYSAKKRMGVTKVELSYLELLDDGTIRKISNAEGDRSF